MQGHLLNNSSFPTGPRLSSDTAKQVVEFFCHIYKQTEVELCFLDLHVITIASAIKLKKTRKPGKDTSDKIRKVDREKD